jgi:hypothetical protein
MDTVCEVMLATIARMSTPLRRTDLLAEGMICMLPCVSTPAKGALPPSTEAAKHRHTRWNVDCISTTRWNVNCVSTTRRNVNCTSTCIKILLNLCDCIFHILIGRPFANLQTDRAIRKRMKIQYYVFNQRDHQCRRYFCGRRDLYIILCVKGQTTPFSKTMHRNTE